MDWNFNNFGSSGWPFNSKSLQSVFSLSLQAQQAAQSEFAHFFSICHCGMSSVAHQLLQPVSPGCLQPDAQTQHEPHADFAHLSSICHCGASASGHQPLQPSWPGATQLSCNDLLPD